MDSPTLLSESNLKRYKGIRSSKKSLYSCGDDFYSKEDERIKDELVGPRSVSLTALVVSPEQKRSHLSVESTRMSQLETLEAKMAKIEVSLSTLGLQQQNQQMNSHGQNSQQQRRKRSGISSATTRSLHGFSASNTRDILQVKEIETLRQSLKDKEHLILNLQTQLRKLSKRKLVHGSITSTDSGVVSLRILSENERKGAEERLSQLDKDMEIKRAEIKRINHRLERLNPSDNIDVRIQQAELEYDLEREELNLMNLQEERRNLHTILDDNDAFQKRTENSLFNSIPENVHMALHSFEVVYEAQNPSFTVGKREDRTGTYVTWTRDDLKTLKRGDRIVEINGAIVISKGLNRIEEFWFDEEGNEQELEIEIGSHPLRIVVLRTPPPPPPPRLPNKELQMLKEEIILISAKLEEVSVEKREILNCFQKLEKEMRNYDEEKERSRLEFDKVGKERDNLKSESVRLKHRISYLEDQMTDLAHPHKDSKNSPSSVTIFQKGSQKTILSESSNKSPKEIHRSNSPNRPPSAASTKNGESRGIKTRLWETFRRATSSDSRSVCSVDSRRPPGEKSNYLKRGKIKPEPPLKPVRLSLQRATSTTNVYATANHQPSSHHSSTPGLKRSNHSENTLLPDWIPHHDDNNTQKKQGNRNGGIRWPSLRPASSMSYTMSNRSNKLAKF